MYDGTTNDERILIKNDSETTLIELGLLDYDLAYSTYSYANENTLLYLDNYVVTAYDVYSTDAIGYLLSKVMISNIYLPTPKNQSDIDFLNNIESVKRGYNAEIHYYSNDDVLSLGEFDINTVYVEGDGIFALGIVYKDEVYSYLSSKMLDRSRKNYALKVMNSAVNTVIIGGDDRTVDNFDYKIDGETKIIYKNSGLPKEILEFYENRITVAPYSPIELYVE